MKYQCKKYEEIGSQIIEELFPELLNVRIAWLASDKKKTGAGGKIIFAECSKVIEKYDWCCPYDFTITVYEPNVDGFTEDQIKILLEHELMHAGVDDKGRTFINPHDSEEFIEIIRKYGIDWSAKHADH